MIASYALSIGLHSNQSFGNISRLYCLSLKVGVAPINRHRAMHVTTQ